MKYLTTLEVARELNVSKQTLLNWLYAKKVPEPPRNRNGYRLWSPARVSLVRQLIREGRLHRRTMVHREPIDDPVVLLEVAREVSQFLKDAEIPHPALRAGAEPGPPAPGAEAARPTRPRPLDGLRPAHSHGMSGIRSRSTGFPPSRCEAQISARSAAVTPAYQTLSGWTATTGPRLQCFRQ